MPDVTTALLQHWMKTVITGYGQMDRKLHKAYQEHELYAADVVQDNEIASITNRLSVYTNGYVMRLLECLSADYAMVQQFTGVEAFRSFAAAYLQWKPSSSFTLYDLGKSFPEFLEKSRPPVPNLSPEQEILFRLPAALAALERARQETILDKGTEQDDPQKEVAIEDIFFNGLTVITPLCLRLLDLPFPVLPVYEALQADTDYTLPSLQTTYMAVTRKNYRLVMEEIPEWQYRFLGHCCKAIDLSSAIQLTENSTGIASDVLLADLYVWLPLLQQRGYISVS